MKPLSFFKVALLPITFPFMAAAALEKGVEKIGYKIGDFIEDKIDPEHRTKEERMMAEMAAISVYRFWCHNHPNTRRDLVFGSNLERVSVSSNEVFDYINAHFSDIWPRLNLSREQATHAMVNQVLSQTNNRDDLEKLRTEIAPLIPENRHGITADDIVTSIEDRNLERSNRLEYFALRATSRYVTHIEFPELGSVLDFLQDSKWAEWQLAEYGISHAEIVAHIEQHEDKFLALNKNPDAYGDHCSKYGPVDPSFDP